MVAEISELTVKKMAETQSGMLDNLHLNARLAKLENEVRYPMAELKEFMTEFKLYMPMLKDSYEAKRQTELLRSQTIAATIRHAPLAMLGSVVFAGTIFLLKRML
jgi:superfamily II RNA helicase